MSGADNTPDLDEVYNIQTTAAGPVGSLALDEQQLLNSPSGDLFGLSQNAGMGWDPAEAGRAQYLILSTQGGLRAPDGKPIALGYHTGHWEIGLLVKAAADEFRALGVIPFAGFCSDPCDGRTQGTTGMFDSLPYRNDAAILFRRLARSLPLHQGVLGIATCDKGLPAMMMALAGLPDRPCVIVPGGVTLPPAQGEDAGTVQTIGIRYAHGLISLAEAAEAGCRACASPGGGCQFLGTAATAQVVSEALGLSLPHSALAPSGQPVWLDMSRRSAQALYQLAAARLKTKDILFEAGKIKSDAQTLVGFALETENEKENAIKKLSKKNADLIVLNSLNNEGAGFGSDTNKITIFDKNKKEYNFPAKTKKEVASDIINTIIQYRNE